MIVIFTFTIVMMLIVSLTLANVDISFMNFLIQNIAKKRGEKSYTTIFINVEKMVK